jgi:uncharacterized protein (TIGR03083 family)
MTPGQAAEAFGAEASALADVIAELTGAKLRRPSPCPPWTIADLLCHIVIAADRIGPAIEASREASGGASGGASGADRGDLVNAAGYYRPDDRFSAAVNADRIDLAASMAARLGSATAIHAELTAATHRSLALLESATADQEVRTRHGDRMLLSEFAITRVVELGVHGLDAAAGLGRQPWLTSQAAAVIENLMLPAWHQDEARKLRARLDCDRAGLIARLTGRVPLTAGDAEVLAELGLTQLALG